MVCLFCRHASTAVVNSRSNRQQPRVWRRRVCPQCGGTVTTYERIANKELPLVQAAMGSSRLSLPRLMLSIHRELPARDNRSADDAWALAETVVDKLLQTPTDPLQATRIAALTYETLHAFDQTAGLRYGLSHRLVTASTRD